jgi:hypothetical protein
MELSLVVGPVAVFVASLVFVVLALGDRLTARGRAGAWVVLATAVPLTVVLLGSSASAAERALAAWAALGCAFALALDFGGRPGPQQRAAPRGPGGDPLWWPGFERDFWRYVGRDAVARRRREPGEYEAGQS